MDDSFDWNKVIKKEAKSNDNKELGEIQGTEYNCLVVERGLVNKEFFYIPKDLVENYDGKTEVQNFRRRDRREIRKPG